MKIIKVTPENVGTFNKNLKTPNVIAFVKIYSDQCGHCKDLQPKWEKLEEEMKNESMEGLLASLSVNDLDDADCDTETQGVPTLRVYEGGKRIMDYEGKRETNDMKLFFKNLLKKQKGGRRKNKKRKTRKRRKNKTKKRRKKKTKKIKGGLSKLGQLKIDAILANTLKGTKKDSEFSDDAIRLLQEIHSTSDNEDEEEELDMDLLKLTGGRKSRRRNKSRKRKSKKRKYKRKKSKRKRTRKR